MIIAIDLRAGEIGREGIAGWAGTDMTDQLPRRRGPADPERIAADRPQKITRSRGRPAESAPGKAALAGEGAVEIGFIVHPVKRPSDFWAGVWASSLPGAVTA